MKKPSAKSRRPPRVFQPMLPRFDVLGGERKRSTEHEDLVRLAEMRSALVAVDELRDAVFGQIAEDIERLDDEEPDAEMDQGNAEQQPRAQRGRGRPKDKHGSLNDMIIWMEFEITTALTNIGNGKRIIRKAALDEMKATRGISKATLTEKSV